MTASRSQRRSASGRIGPHRPPRMGTTDSLSHTLRTPPTSTPKSTDPFREVACQYMDPLCTTHNQMNLTNSLL